MQTERAHVYVLANGYKRLYTGVTSELRTRIRQHQSKLHPASFTARYNITQLVWFEEHLSITAAIKREKQIKGWLRIKKLNLIIQSNPTWRDLSPDLLNPICPTEPVRPPATF